MNKVLALMPVTLIVASVAYHALNNRFLTVTCFVLALLFWFVLFGEKNKTN